MGQALYRKYRSKALSEIVGQEHITTTLDRAIKDGKLAHAYLFTGPRGVGKTSIARILAHQINDIEYTDESMHLDIIEIDAASNRRIDEIRELRDKIHIAPTSAKYKVYIIDEVHMLTKEAFNALLKTLEEPPAHVVFILATTELHKVPDTIISRTQRFAFKPVESGKVVAHLRFIADTEAIEIDDQALQLIAEHGGGSFRDSISLLDQMRNSPDKPITADVVRLLLGVPEAAATELLLDTILQGQQHESLSQVQQLIDQGFGSVQIAAQLYDQTKQRLLDGTQITSTLCTLLQNLLKVSASHNPDIALELVIIEASLPTQPTPTTLSSAPSTPEARQPAPIQQAPPVRTESPKPAVAVKTPVSPVIETPSPQPEVVPAAPAPNSASIEVTSTVAEPSQRVPFDAAIWSSVLMEAKNHNNTLYGVLRMAQPSFDGSKLVLAFAFAFHQKKINDATNKGFISEWIRKLSGQQVSVEVIVDKNAQPGHQEATSAPIDNAPPPVAPPPDMAAPPVAKPSGEGVKSVMDVFGGGEVL